MEESIKFNSSVCTSIKQSKRLLELGLKPETADMCWFNDMQKPVCTPYKCFVDKAQDMKWVFSPAWSLHRLLCMLDYDNAATFDIMPNLAYEDVIATISLRIGCGAFNKEYLNESKN